MSIRWLARVAFVTLPALLQGCLFVELYGPVTGATVTIAPLRGGDPLVENASSYSQEQTEAAFGAADWAELPEVEKLQFMGAVDLPRDDFEKRKYYLVTATGGLDYDYNTDQQRDGQGEPILGTWHAILRGSHLRGMPRISVMTEAIYQYLLPDLDDMSDAELARALDEAAARVVHDINGDGVTNYKDVVRWSSTEFASEFRGEEFLWQRLREDIEWDLSADTLAIDSLLLVERAPLKPAMSDSPWAEDLVYCLTPVYVPDLCSLYELPLLGDAAVLPTVDDLMSRTVVTHDWMAERFEQFLQQMPDMLFTLARSVSAIVISDAVRPAYFDGVTNAVYLDPDFFWLTADEYATVSEEEDYRREFASRVSFTDLARYVRDGESVGARAFDTDENGARTLEQALPYAAAVLFHEFVHANDAIPSSEFDQLNRFLSPYQLNLTGISDGLIEESPLLSPELFGVAGVLFQGYDPTPEEAAYTPRQIGGFFGSDRATDLYAFSTQFEDLAMLVEEFMMATYFDTHRDTAFANVPEGDSDVIECDDYVMAWGQRNRVSIPRIRQRLEFALSAMLPDVDFSAELAALPPLKALPNNSGWCEYLDDLSNGVRPATNASRAMERRLPMRGRAYE